jgi:hypothetical protein
MYPIGIQTIGAAITWLSGAVAGLGAIFYAFGYLASMSSVHLLGVALWSLRYDYTFYIQRGASFFLLLVVDTAGYLLLVLMLVLAILFAFRGSRLLYQWLAIRPFRRFTLHHLDWQGIAYVGLLFLLALQVSTHLSWPEWMDVSGILQSATYEQSAAGPIREWILSGNERSLQNEFTYLATQEVWIGALLLLAWRVSRGRRWAVLRTAPFAVVFVISTVFAAGAYGTLALPVKFLEASIPAEDPSAKLYLLNQIPSGYVFWDCPGRQTRWVPIETRVTFSERRTLRQILQSCNGAGP